MQAASSAHFAAPAPHVPRADSRIGWVDYAKGLCILLVVMFHTVNHYENAVGETGWMRWMVDFSKPFRMPDFFLVSGLFLARTINAPLRDFIDRKVFHFAYFYLLWLTITLVITDNDVLRANPVEWVRMFAWHIIQPVGTLWFVHMLAIFYIFTRAIRSAPAWAVLAVAGGLQIAHQGGWLDTPSFALSRAMDYYVFFFFGYTASTFVFAFAEQARGRRLETIGVLAAWGVGNWWLTQQGVHFIPGAGLLMGFAGALAVIQLSVLLAQTNMAGAIRYCGKNSIVIYLTFFFPMLALERTLAKVQVIPDTGLACAIIIAMSVALPLAFHAMIKRTPLIALYVRPDWAKLQSSCTAAKPALA